MLKIYVMKNACGSVADKCHIHSWPTQRPTHRRDINPQAASGMQPPRWLWHTFYTCWYLTKSYNLCGYQSINALLCTRTRRTTDYPLPLYTSPPLHISNHGEHIEMPLPGQSVRLTSIRGTRTNKQHPSSHYHPHRRSHLTRRRHTLQ